MNKNFIYDGTNDESINEVMFYYPQQHTENVKVILATFIFFK